MKQEKITLCMVVICCLVGFFVLVGLGLVGLEALANWILGVLKCRI